MNASKNYQANREYKSTVFSKLFGENMCLFCLTRR